MSTTSWMSKDLSISISRPFVVAIIFFSGVNMHPF